ncbi:hypothetical protein BGZ93_003652 [Podila epicladia]|nr:hypothetical protein BGZ93_003652 [Podila epicladia]
MGVSPLTIRLYFEQNADYCDPLDFFKVCEFVAAESRMASDQWFSAIARLEKAKKVEEAQKMRAKWDTSKDARSQYWIAKVEQEKRAKKMTIFRETLEDVVLEEKTVIAKSQAEEIKVHYNSVAEGRAQGKTSTVPSSQPSTTTATPEPEAASSSLAIQQIEPLTPGTRPLDDGPFMPDPDRAIFAVLKQAISWTRRGVDFLDLFFQYQEQDKSLYSIARDHIADISPESAFIKFLPSNMRIIAMDDTFPTKVIDDVWPEFRNICERVLKPDGSYEDVCQALRKEDSGDPIVAYMLGIIYSYSHYFQFHNNVPSDINEREGFGSFTWTIIRGALTLAGIESRQFEIPITAVDIRKNSSRDLLVEQKHQAHNADGVGMVGSAQIYLAEAAKINNAAAEKKLSDMFKLKRDMRDSWVAQMRFICREVSPPSRLAVFGSVSFEDETKFYAMDFSGVFRLHQINSMIIPLEKARFARGMKSCMTSCLEFVLHLQAEMDRRKNVHELGYKEKSLRLAPSSKAATAGSASVLDTSNSYGLHDTMRFGMRQIASEVSAKHPLENRLAEWDNTQLELKMNMARNLHGMHAPIKMAMEQSLVTKARGVSMLPQSNLGLDILLGKDESIDFEDFLNVPAMSTDMVDIHSVMEHKLGLRV